MLIFPHAYACGPAANLLTLIMSTEASFSSSKVLQLLSVWKKP